MQAWWLYTRTRPSSSPPLLTQLLGKVSVLGREASNWCSSLGAVYFWRCRILAVRQVRESAWPVTSLLSLRVASRCLLSSPNMACLSLGSSSLASQGWWKRY